MFQSARTALRLLLNGDFQALTRRLRYRWRLARMGSGRSFIYRRAGARFLLDPAHQASIEAYLGDLEDRIELQLWRAWLRAGDHAIDGGAHAGLYAFAGAPEVQPGLMLAVEADGVLADMLVEASTKLALQSSVAVAACAISDQVGEAEFYFGCHADQQVLQSLRSPGRDFVARKVPMQTLGGLAEQHFGAQMPAAVKLDLEGAEALALASSAVPARWFEADGPLWLLELNMTALARFGATPEQIMRRFPESAYALHLIAHYPTCKPGDLGPARDFRRWDSAVYFNLVAIPQAATHGARRAAIAPYLR